MANTTDKVIKIALNEIGYLEKKSNKNLDNKTANAGCNNYTKYGEYFRMNPAQWCDLWVDWCFCKAFGKSEAEKLLGGFSAYTPTSAQYFKNMGRWHTNNPKMGDVIFFKNNIRICHTGLVYKVDSSYVYTIEGNTSSTNGVVSNGGAVEKKKYSIGNSRIAGYGRPKYDVSTPKPLSNKINTIKEVQNWANTNYNSKIITDGIYGNKTKMALVKILQIELNQTYGSSLYVDGIWGDKTRSVCRTLKKGCKNDVVGVLQALLICNKCKDIYLDKHYGSVTASSVKEFQKRSKLVVDGLAGKDTFAKLCT